MAAVRYGRISAFEELDCVRNLGPALTTPRGLEGRDDAVNGECFLSQCNLGGNLLGELSGDMKN